MLQHEATASAPPALHYPAPLLTAPPAAHLCEEVVEGLVGVRDHQGALGGAVVVQDVHDLHSGVGLARACRGPGHKQQQDGIAGE